MATKTTDDMLAEIRRHIDELEARADSGAAETRARLQDRFDRLREEEASAWAAVRERDEAVDEKFRQLEIDIAIAENRLASEMADDATSFAEAVEAELHEWDAAIERLQTRAATKAQNAREQAEAEIAALRQRAEPGSRASDRAARGIGGRVARGEEPRHGSARRPRAEGPRGGPEVPLKEEDMTTESTPTETFESKVSNEIDEAASEGERMLARVWKILAANGVAAILFGFVLVLWPDIGLTTIVAVVAVYALFRGVLSGMAAFSAPLPRDERGWLTLEAIVGTAIGIALLVWNDISATALLYVVAAWAIAIGVLMLAAAIQLPLSGGRRLLLALNGLVAGAFGAVMFIEPDAGAVAIVALIAAFMIVIGIMQVGFALELRNVAVEFRQRFPRPNTTKPVAHA